MNKTVWRAALRDTSPVMLGYLAIGTAFGVMMNAVGLNALWSALMSLTVYAGSAQILGVGLIAAGTALADVALLTLILNIRHIVYGLSMLERFRGAGRWKWYLIFALTDETYALLSAANVPEDIEPRRYYLAVALLDQGYWIAGSVIGGIVGALLPFDSTGVDFAMTALFVVIAVEQWENAKSHLPALLGAGATLLSILLLGADSTRLLLPALAIIVVGLAALRPYLAPKAGEEGAE